jgi:uncharacterized membrane protein YedE/YeeE
MLNLGAFIFIVLAFVILALGWFTAYLAWPLWVVLVVGAALLLIGIVFCFLSALRDME